MLALAELFVAGVIRYWLITSDYQQIIANRVELSTPLNSWKRLVEGVYLYEERIDPYQGDMFHETPLMLITFYRITKSIPQLLPLIFTLCDLSVACCLYLTTKKFMSLTEQSQNANGYTMLLLRKDDFAVAPMYVLTFYLFNPYSVLNCAAMTTTVISNMWTSLALVSMIHGHRIICCVAIATAANQALYPCLLIVPAAIFIENSSKGCAKCSYLRTLTVFVFTWAGEIFLSAYLMDGSYKFLENTYGFILNVPDLKPNVGLFWYFFTEMFEHFRLLFICAFQINATLLYVIPLTLRFRNEPLLLATTLITLTTIFKSYPSLGDVALYLAMLPMWRHLFTYMQQKFIVGCFILVTSALGPTVWHLWIYSRSANANFFFGVTLAFATAQIFLITDLLFAYIKREHDMKYGLGREIDGKPAKLVLR